MSESSRPPSGGARTSGSPAGGARTSGSPERELGDVATRVLFENERVRVWQLKLEPGAESATHRHDLDYLLVQVAGDRIAAVPEPDAGGPYTEYVESDVKPGRTVFIPRGGIETARNVGSETYREILIELKD